MILLNAIESNMIHYYEMVDLQHEKIWLSPEMLQKIEELRELCELEKKHIAESIEK